jgi:ribosomal protein L11 methyltransferase
MKWAEITVHTTQEATEAVAHIFATVGATGVIIEDPQLVEQYRNSGCWDYCDLPVSEDTMVRVIGYLPMLSDWANALEEIRRRVDELDECGLDKGSGEITWTDIAEEDWATGWKKYYHPVRVGHRLVIKPSWEEFASEPQDLIIELDPGMAFGTGTHATTTLCMEAIETYLKPGMSVVDVGTGSGVLAVAAAKLGASSVLAIDLDPVAVKAAQENVVMNDAQNLVRVLHGDLLQRVTEPADMVVANIIANVIIGMAADVPKIMKPQGLFIASGIIDERLAEVKEAIAHAGLHTLLVQQKNGWSAIIARKE